MFCPTEFPPSSYLRRIGNWSGKCGAPGPLFVAALVALTMAGPRSLSK